MGDIVDMSCYTCFLFIHVRPRIIRQQPAMLITFPLRPCSYRPLENIMTQTNVCFFGHYFAMRILACCTCTERHSRTFWKTLPLGEWFFLCQFPRGAGSVGFLLRKTIPFPVYMYIRSGWRTLTKLSISITKKYMTLLSFFVCKSLFFS